MYRIVAMVKDDYEDTADAVSLADVKSMAERVLGGEGLEVLSVDVTEFASLQKGPKHVQANEGSTRKRPEQAKVSVTSKH